MRTCSTQPRAAPPPAPLRRCRPHRAPFSHPQRPAATPPGPLRPPRAAAPDTTSTQPPSTLQDDYGAATRAVGCLVGSMCADVLARPAHGIKSHRVQKEFPRGLTDPYRFAFDAQHGTHTGTTQQLLAFAQALAAGTTDAASVATAHARAFDGTRTYLPYERLAFTVLNLNLVFNELRAAITVALAARGVDPGLLDQKAFIYWFREYVDLFGNLGPASDLYGGTQVDYLGVEDEVGPESAYRAYRQRLTTRTAVPDPLGLQRFSGLITRNDEFVQQAAADFAAYVAANFETQYMGLVAARGYIRGRLKATPESLPVLARLWESGARLLRLPAAISTLPPWWFQPFFSRAVDPETQSVGIVEELLGNSHDELAAGLQQALATYGSSYTSFVHTPGGASDCGAPARAAPAGLALSGAAVPQLRACLHDALVCTHPDRSALDAATVVAAAVQWLAAAAPGADGCTPQGLLGYLVEEVAGTDAMQGRLLLVRGALFEMGPVADWRDAWGSEDWHRMLRLHQCASQRGFAMEAVDAAAVALFCLCCNWQRPRQAVECAVHLGGWACATASMVGALAGALHGTAWVPGSWWESLEAGTGGRDLAVALGQQLVVADQAPAAGGSNSSSEPDAGPPAPDATATASASAAWFA